MKIRAMFAVQTALQSLAIAAIIWGTARALSPSVILYIIEGIVALTLGWLLYFYYKIIKPLEVIGNGMDLLREQDFASRIRMVGQPDSDRIVDIFNRMMEQLKDERLRLREQNRFLDLLIQASPMGVIILDLDGRMSSINPSARRLLGTGTSVDGLPLSSIAHPLVQELATITDGSARTVRLGDAHIYKCIHSSFADRGFYHSFYLIEELTEEVRRAEAKAYETVIRMIAHEVNNTTAGLTSTLDTVAAALRDMGDTEEIADAIDIVVTRCYGMNRFISNYADVVRIPEPQLCDCDLNHVVSSGAGFMSPACESKNIRLCLSLAPDPVPVRLDPILFEQVLVNIIKNSSESIAEEGIIYIRTTSSPATVEIADTGRGIDRATEGRLFTPFFSTKPNGQGLGLIFVRETLDRHSFTYSLRTGDDGLTRFRIICEAGGGGGMADIFQHEDTKARRAH
jgi:nitrogen fixation/metabolism regulation signal transduction histidine kinase